MPRTNHRSHSLSLEVLLTLCLGLLLPALVGGLILTNLRQTELRAEQDASLTKTLNLLAAGLAPQVWTLDLAAIKTLADATLRDSDVIRLRVTQDKSGALASTPLYEAAQVARPEGPSRVVQQDLMHRQQRIGQLELELNDAAQERTLLREQRAYGLVLLAQFGFVLLVSLLLLRRAVSGPMTRLTQFSSQLASGDLDHPLHWRSRNEVGRLAQHMDQMRVALRSSMSEQKAILNNIHVGVMFVRGHQVQMANPEAERIFGYAPGSMLGLPTSALSLADEIAAADSELHRAAIALEIDGSYALELRLKRQDGTPFWALMRGSATDTDPVMGGSIWVFEDISKRKLAEAEITTLAFYDALTQLPNRRLLMERLKQALAGNRRAGHDGALLFVDLDNFKALNDSLGHDAGDLLLKQVAERLTSSVRSGDTVARTGGDEFVVVLGTLSGDSTDAAQQAQSVGENILNCLRQAYQLGSHERHITASIGISLFHNPDGEVKPVEILFKQADLALYQAKSAGRNALRFFVPEMQTAVSSRASLEADLHSALSKHQLQMYVQPQVDERGVVTGGEALLRWNHPAKGLVPASEFIPLAEESGLIVPIGQWVLTAACELLTVWATRPALAGLSLAVNVSPRHFSQPQFVADLLDLLSKTQAPAHRLKLEISERMLLRNATEVIAKMSQLRSSAVAFSLDNFGTGYSSLAHVKRLPLDQIKIDKSFVHALLTDASDAAIARTVITLAHNLGISVLAEGVETPAQRSLLLQQSCHAYQGDLFSPPVPVAVFENYVAACQV
jgi:diguanylate cyclase (GGDEF)-like protein/PAS domain S-box-containing protein